MAKRQVVLDTETTGLDPKKGHRIIEIGCIEVLDRSVTRSTYHRYINPQREIDQGAIDVHGITNEFLADKPCFADIAEEFLDFVQDADLIIHNAPFDTGFINHELRLLAHPLSRIEKKCTIIDSLVLARQKHPGQKNSLDALCKRYKVDNSQRELHGALLDAKLLATVYLAMTGGQGSFFTQVEQFQSTETAPVLANSAALDTSQLKVIHASADELLQHQETLKRIDDGSGEQCLWVKEE